MSYKLIKNCGISSLVAIVFLLGLLTYIVANRVWQYDQQINKNLSYLMLIRKMENRLHHIMISIQQVILESRFENELLLADIDGVVKDSREMELRLKSSSREALLDHLSNFQHKLRVLKAALINYGNEVRYDPSADTTSGLERVVMEIRDQSDGLFRRLAKEGVKEIQFAHQMIGEIVKKRAIVIPLRIDSGGGQWDIVSGNFGTGS